MKDNYSKNKPEEERINGRRNFIKTLFGSSAALLGTGLVSNLRGDENHPGNTLISTGGAYRYGGKILMEHTWAYSSCLTLHPWIDLTKGDLSSLHEALLDPYKEHISEILRFMKGERTHSGCEEMSPWYPSYHLPFVLAMYASSNAPKVEGRFLKGNKNWQTREYTITLNGLPITYPKQESTMTFVDAPRNDEIGDHLKFEGEYPIEGFIKKIKGVYDIEDTKNSWCLVSDEKLRSGDADHVLEGIMELYKEGIINNLETIIQRIDQAKRKQ